MRTIRPSSPLIPIAVLALLLTACAGGAASASSAPASGAAAAGAAAAEADDQDAGNLSGVGEAPRPASSAAGDQSSDGVGAPIDDARIIRTGTIDLEVTDVPTALRTARDGIRALGGYIGASNTSNDGERPIATITYRVPANRWEDALDLLRGLNGLTSKVVGEQTQAVEVTGQVIDLEARIRNLRASEDALQEIASKAVRVSDVLEVQDQRLRRIDTHEVNEVLEVLVAIPFPPRNPTHTLNMCPRIAAAP